MNFYNGNCVALPCRLPSPFHQRFAAPFSPAMLLKAFHTAAEKASAALLFAPQENFRRQFKIFDAKADKMDRKNLPRRKATQISQGVYR